MSDPTDLLARPWYHTIELPDGRHTPGWYDTRGVPALIDWPQGVAGGRCLDVGTFDGFWAFELEHRGAASVTALDLDDPRRLDWPFDDRERGPALVREWATDRGPGFEALRSVLGSTVERVDGSVYELQPDRFGSFDVVLCGALLLHLRDPIAALEAMRSVCAGELRLIEAIDPELELRARRSPAASFGPDWDQWWRANTAGLNSMVHRAGFEIVWTSKRFIVPYGPAATGMTNLSQLPGLLARRPRARGVLFRAIRARPRDAVRTR